MHVKQLASLSSRMKVDRIYRIGEVNPCLKYSIKVLLGCLFLLLFAVFFRFICAIHLLYGVFFNLFLHLHFMILRNLTAAHAIFV